MSGTISLQDSVSGQKLERDANTGEDTPSKFLDVYTSLTKYLIVNKILPLNDELQILGSKIRLVADKSYKSFHQQTEKTYLIFLKHIKNFANIRGYSLCINKTETDIRGVILNYKNVHSQAIYKKTEAALNDILNNEEFIAEIIVFLIDQTDFFKTCLNVYDAYYCLIKEPILDNLQDLDNIVIKIIINFSDFTESFINKTVEETIEITHLYIDEISILLDELVDCLNYVYKYT